MNKICWWLVDVVSRTLDAKEREAVRGDLAESGASGRHALHDVLGLVVRRQAAAWVHWKPWLTLVCLIVPLSMLLSLASKFTADETAVYVWMYAYNWNWDLLKNVGFWYELVHVVGIVLLESLTLACLSWTSGFVLGAASRRMVQMNSLLFGLMLLFGVVLGAPLYLAYYSRYVQHAFGLHFVAGQAPVPVSIFFRIFPLMVQGILVVLPSLWGLRQSAASPRLRLSLRIVAWMAAITTVAVMTIQTPGVGLLLKLYRWRWIWQSRPIRLLQFVIYWPVVYVAANAFLRRWSRRAAAV
ncbi:MAG TPA: hypothetical protein VI685_21610, partial [Candidatus Angelobacter sp.]